MAVSASLLSRTVRRVEQFQILRPDRAQGLRRHNGGGSGQPIERQDGAPTALTSLIAATGEDTADDLHVSTIVDEHGVVGPADAAAAPVIDTNRIGTARRPPGGPGDVLVTHAVDPAAGVRIEIELAAAGDFAAAVIDLLAAGCDDMQVNVAVGVPGERDLDVARADLRHARGESDIWTNRSRRSRNRKLQIEFGQPDALWIGQEDGRGGLRRRQ